MKTYLMGDFLTGLQAATGLTSNMLWAPTRKVSHGSNPPTSTDDITDTLWLPTEWGLFGSVSGSSQTYEVTPGQARLEYYTGATERKKYNSSNNAQGYRLASPISYSGTSFAGVYSDGYSWEYTASVASGCAPAFCVK
jgi:hypothetical protein